MGHLAFKLRQMFQESQGIQNIMAVIYILELKERRHACYAEGKHKERITSTAMKIPWESSISV